MPEQLVTLRISSKLLSSLVPPSNTPSNSTPPTSTPPPSNNPTRPGPSRTTGLLALKALDRTGAPVRKWEKKGIELKSFTGFKYSLDVWRGESQLGGPSIPNGPSELNEPGEPGESRTVSQATSQATSRAASPSKQMKNGGSQLAKPPMTVGSE